MYPPVHQLGSLRGLEAGPHHQEARDARRTSLAVRRRQELELQRSPVAGRPTRPTGTVSLAEAERARAAVVALLTVTAFVVLFVAASVTVAVAVVASARAS